MQEIFGYFCVPITKAQKSFILCGLANVGKSKILETLQDVLLGRENVSNIPLQNLSDRFHPAELFGKLANIYADLSDKAIDDAGMFKAATGEDYITGERKHKDPFSFKPHARFGYSCNFLPPNYGDRSEAFYRRIIIILFYKVVPPEIKDIHLMEKLMLEADGILTWAIAGLKRLIKNDYQFSETERTIAETHKYRILNNNVLAFVEENCVIEEGAVSYRKEMYARYKEFCSDGGVGKAMGEGKFNANVRSADPSRIEMAAERVTRRMIFKGIRLAD
jgi:putative DNA primase/helicase